MLDLKSIAGPFEKPTAAPHRCPSFGITGGSYTPSHVKKTFRPRVQEFFLKLSDPAGTGRLSRATHDNPFLLRTLSSRFPRKSASSHFIHTKGLAPDQVYRTLPKNTLHTSLAGSAHFTMLAGHTQTSMSMTSTLLLPPTWSHIHL